ncbi:MAG: hypothetical protein HDT23_04335 [Ruminococcus sp.]|nr:hypothetical protein [Ruminococcus sp.]
MTDDEKKLIRQAQARDYYYNWGGKEYHQMLHKAYYREHREERIAYQRAYYRRKKAELQQKEVSENATSEEV